VNVVVPVNEFVRLEETVMVNVVATVRFADVGGVYGTT
jgi:hypothetical protein